MRYDGVRRSQTTWLAGGLFAALMGVGVHPVHGQDSAVSQEDPVPERLTRILRAQGVPMTADELLPFFPDRSPATVRNALIEHDSFVRVSRDEFDLAA